MKKIACCLVCAILLTMLCACDTVPEFPTSGIWYCEELKITVEFAGEYVSNAVVKWDDPDTDLKMVIEYGGYMDFYYFNEDHIWTTVYDGPYKYKNDELRYNVRYKINPDDPNGDQLKVNEHYIFKLIDDYDQVEFLD